MKILFNYASRSRPEKFIAGMKNIFSQAAGRDFVIRAVLDEDDPTIDEYYRLLIETGFADDKRVFASLGRSEGKIHAINRPIVECNDWRILINFSDDQRFTIFGFDLLIQNVMPLHTDAFLHFHEKDSAERVCVMSILGRRYYDRDRFIYNPVYLSLFADEEATRIAKIRDKYMYLTLPLFIHDNPAVTGIGVRDEMLTKQQEIGWTVDLQTFKTREAANFYL